MPAGPSLRRRVVAAGGLPVVDSKSQTLADDFSLGPLDQGDMNPEGSTSLGCRLESQVGHFLESFDVLRSAVWIAAVVQCIDPRKQIEGSQYLGPPQRVAEKEGVAGRDVGDGNLPADLIGR